MFLSVNRDDEIVFDDLAFFDSALYQSFSDLLMDAFSSKYTDEEFMDVYCFCFEVCGVVAFFNILFKFENGKYWHCIEESSELLMIENCGTLDFILRSTYK